MGQSEHIDEPIPEILPATQGTHDAVPACSAKVPAGHGEHSMLPVSIVNVPGAQGVQVVVVYNEESNAVE